MSAAIKIENVSKQYRLGEVGTGTLSHDLHRAWAKLRGKPDPFAKVGQVNDRTVPATDGKSSNSTLATSNSDASSAYAWALKDINFEVEQGEILGIIGRNGAGKSTLLKLLSRVTAPTTGTIKTKGRIASLLEVGTGFHPELTGRENVYLNGAIMGMTRPEITRRLDEIVEFSGCAKYIDTPVKRYSSGMTVRLGFAVAAHLDCEILVVDEVLAVGDADFQKKCIGKMQEVAKAVGKSVLFVSHNMNSIASLCHRGLLLDKGRCKPPTDIHSALDCYLSAGQQSKELVLPIMLHADHLKLREFTLKLKDAANVKGSVTAEIKLKFENLVHDPNLNVGLALFADKQERAIYWTFLVDWHDQETPTGEFKCVVDLPLDNLAAGKYRVELVLAEHNRGWIIRPGSRTIDIDFDLHPSGSGGRLFQMTTRDTTLMPLLPWSISQNA